MIEYMKDFVRSILKKIIESLQLYDYKLTALKNENLPYNTLSPIKTVDIENGYKKALDWAFSNRKKLDIKNIALTGPYGSGKSSILKTYVANYKKNDLQFLNISLATFTEEGSKVLDNKDDLRLVELSILQQIFYHEENKKIPDSRFRKIKSFSKIKLSTTTCLIFLSFLAVIHFTNLNLVDKLFIPKFNLDFSNIIHYGALLFIAISGWLIMYKSIRTISNIKINKLSIKDSEIGFAENKNKSILNHHLEEILYFFEVTNYNVIILEDLDRFKQTEIFTKLREINILINNSKKVKNVVVFLYAIRDDMFCEENERTKFFDFIIPVIPIINSSNSSQKLLEKQALYNYNISEDLMDSISLFIDDMRLLNNIFNEFYLYQQKLNGNLNQNKLLAIIVYKNIFPTDFTLLSNNEGMLFASLNDKQKYIIKQNEELDIQISELKSRIQNLENLIIIDVRELRFIYLAHYISTISNFNTFHVNGLDISIIEMVKEQNFDFLINNKVVFRNAYYNRLESLIQFSEIEKRVNTNYKYIERQKQIEDFHTAKTEVLKKEIQELESNKSRNRNQKVSELLKKGNIDIGISNPKQKGLVEILLRDAFIEEDYLDYLSIFYPGSITKEDHQFLINVKSKLYTGFDFKLYKIEKLIPKINQSEFDKEYALNFSLLDFVLDKSAYKNIRDLIFKKLIDESTISIKFIDSYIDISLNISIFINQLINTWISIWSFVDTKSNFTIEQKEKYFKLIFEYSDVTDIKRLYNDIFFQKTLLQNNNFLIIITDQNKIKEIIKSLNIKFTNLDINDIPSEFINLIYTENHYVLSINMIKTILRLNSKYNENEFYSKNYSAILNSNCKSLIDYINSNLPEYIENVYLKLDLNVNDNEITMTKLLNQQSLSFETKIQIIKKVIIQIEFLSTIEELEIKKVLFKESKIAPTWQNILNQYQSEENIISKTIIKFLEINSNTLSKHKISMDFNGTKEYYDFIKNLITNEDLNNETYNILLNSIPYRFSILKFESLSENKVFLLIHKNILVFDVNNYNLLKNNFHELHIKFLELNISDFITVIANYELNNKDVLLLLKSSIISIEEKNVIIEKIDEALFASEKDSIKLIGLLILKQNNFRVSNSILKLIVVNNELSVEQRIKIFNWKQSQIDNLYLETFLNTLGNPYSEITSKGKNPLIPNNNQNLKMAEIINDKDYISSFTIENKGSNDIRISTYRKLKDSN